MRQLCQQFPVDVILELLKKIGGTETNLTLVFDGLNANTIKGAK